MTHGRTGTLSLSFLVNDSPTKEVLVNKRLRQGDPFTPFLSLIIIEGLNGIMRNAIEKGMFKGFKAGVEVHISRL